MIAGTDICGAPIADFIETLVVGGERTEVRLDIQSPFTQDRVIRAGVNTGKRYAARVRLVPRYDAAARIFVR